MKKNTKIILIIIAAFIVITGCLLSFLAYKGISFFNKVVEEDKMVTEYNNKTVEIRDDIVDRLETLTYEIDNDPTYENVLMVADLMDKETDKLTKFIETNNPPENAKELKTKTAEYATIARELTSLARKYTKQAQSKQDFTKTIQSYNEKIAELNKKNNEIGEYVNGTSSFEYDYDYSVD